MVSENGSETASVADAPAKRRGRPRKTITADLEQDTPEAQEPPAKKPRGRPRKTETATAEPEDAAPAAPARKPGGSGRRNITPVVEVPINAVTLGSPLTPKSKLPDLPQVSAKEEVDEGEEAEIEDEPKRVSDSWQASMHSLLTSLAGTTIGQER